LFLQLQDEVLLQWRYDLIVILMHQYGLKYGIQCMNAKDILGKSY
jgi:hypothetical protein